MIQLSLKKDITSFILMFSNRSVKLFTLKNCFLITVKALCSIRIYLTMQAVWQVKHCGCGSCFRMKEWVSLVWPIRNWDIVICSLLDFLDAGLHSPKVGWIWKSLLPKSLDLSCHSTTRPFWPFFTHCECCCRMSLISSHCTGFFEVDWNGFHCFMTDGLLDFFLRFKALEVALFIRTHRLHLYGGDKITTTTTSDLNGEAPVMPELWRMQSTSSLPSLPSPLWHGMVASDRVFLSMGQIELFDI